MARVVGATRQLHALESLFDFIEQYVAYAGRSVVWVAAAVVYEAQKVTASNDDAVKALAQGSVSGLSQAIVRVARNSKKTIIVDAMKVKTNEMLV